MATTVGPTSDIAVNDLYVYAVDAHALATGALPYRDFGFEYPPLALLAIALPHALGGSFETWFAIEMALFGLVCQELLRALAGPRAAWLWALAPLAVGAQIRTHFDLAAVAVLLGALLAFVRERPRAGFALLAVGGLVKLFPLLLVPVAGAWLWGRGQTRQLREGLAWCVGVLVVGTAPFWLLGGFGDMFRFHLDRPVQIESTPATALFALGGSYVTGTAQHPDGFKSNGLDGGHADLVLALSTVALVAVVVMAIVLAARAASARQLLLCCYLALLAFVGLGKVLSPQYMIWLAPFVVLALVGRELPIAGWTITAIVLTQTWFPGRYFDLVDADSDIVTVVALRNFCLIMAVAATATAIAQTKMSGSSSPSPSPAR